MVNKIQEWEFGDWEDTKWKWVLARWKRDNQDILLFKPTTYMNLSWDAVSALVNYYKCNPTTDILVISDDIDMEFGKIRYRTKWSHGGQNGLRDTIAKLWTDEFPRIKIGTGRDDRYSVSDWVLSKFTKEEQEKVQGEIFDWVEKKIAEWLRYLR